jgi:glutathione S-transferase
MTIPDLKLVSHKLCPYVQRARIVLAEKCIPHEIAFIDLSAKPDWFVALSPLGKVPLLLVDGRPLFESNVIVEYLDEITPVSLHPPDIFEKAQNRSWMEFGSATLGAVATFYRAADAAALDAAAATLKDRFRALENQLGRGPWFNGKHFSLVDAAYAPLFRYFNVIEQFTSFDLFHETSKVRAWREALAERPSVRGAVVPDYIERLHRFFVGLGSELTSLIGDRRVA